MTSTRRSAWLITPLFLMALVFLAWASPAGAQVPGAASNASHFLGVKTRGHSAPANQNMIYHGGPIMANTSTDYLIFWEPPGSQISKRFNALVTRYFHDVGTSQLYHNNSQYTDKQGGMPTGSQFGAAYVDKNPYPSNYISDQQLQQEITRVMQVEGWTASLDNVFFVYTTRNIHICFDNQHRQCSPNTFCAYHNNFGNTLYAAMPDVLCGTPDSPNHDPEADNLIDSTSHEQNEAATDPQGTAWYNAQGNEIGDLCSTSYGPLKYHGGDVYWNGHPYTLQEEWDNAKSACVIKGP